MAGANVTVSGMPREMGGLKESVTAFRKHWKDVGDALLNVSGIDTATGQPTDKDEPRMAYEYQPFPKMVFHAEHGELTVENQTELDEALTQKYRLEPYVKPQVHMGDPKAEKVALQKELKEKDGQITALGDALQKALSRLDALEAANEVKPSKK